MVLLCHCVLSRDVDRLAGALSDTFLRSLNTHAPTRSFVVRKPPVSWLTDDLRTRFRHRNVLFKQAKRSNSLLGYAIYRHVRNVLDRDIKNARSTYHFNLLRGVDDPTKM